ncbi:sensor domain-containing protein [Mycobacterium sp. CBMA293]|nr:sensor domain-containing protein [Mycolicibacterium sp. CBMA 360]MUM08538.1 hypothetical protein [Mycolicibacterium sp. CBMA 213]MUM14671.1 sensor domain-containing protein [Mycolicibacterium sp. CBMA 293]
MFMRTRTILTLGVAAVIVAPSASCQYTDSGSPRPAASSSSSSARPTDTGTLSPAPSTPAPAAGPLVQMDQLKGLLPSASEVSAAVNVPNLAISESHDALSLLPDDYVSDMSCVGAIADAAIQPYSETPVVSVRSQDYTPADGSNSLTVITSAVLYEAAQDALDQVAATVTGWHACAGKSVQVKSTPTSTFTIGTEVVTNDLHTLTDTGTAPPDWSCGRGITSRNNVVIDLTVCGKDAAAVRANAQGLLSQISSKVPA